MPNIRRLCTIEGDMSQMASAVKEMTIEGKIIWKMKFEVVLRFQSTAIQAKLRWKDEV
jgi:hypothetical protein